MQLIIMRHGDAVRHAPTDPERPLSPLGEQQTQDMVGHLLDLPPLRILVSPYLRAQQTAQIVANGLAARHGPIALETVANITPDDNPKSALATLADYECERLLVVSHQPLVGSLLSLLLHGHYQGNQGFPTAAMACLDALALTPGAAKLVWMREPK